LVGSTVYSSNATAASAVSGIYLSMAENSVGGNSHGISALLGLSADEFTLYPNGDPILNQTYINALLANNAGPQWGDLYNCIYQANSAIAGISASTGMTTSMKQQLIGEAEFIRAFCNFYLVNMYGEIPLTTSTAYQVNEVLARSPLADVYQQIVTDLSGAQSLLSVNYLAPDGSTTSERVRPNQGTATALLARVYLYEQKWDSAAAEATAVINSPNYQLVGELDSAFLAGNTEAIWQLEIPDNGFNAPDAAAFLLSYYGGPNAYAAPFILSSSLVSSFEPGDLRMASWVDSVIVGSVTYYFPYKYQFYYTGQPPVQYPTIFRLAEQFLIRAEAEANGATGGTGAAIADLNVIRTRAQLPLYSGARDAMSVLNAIMHERRVELFTEYGHRWLDLIRTGNVNAVMGAPGNGCQSKGGTWSSSDSLYPIPLSEIKADPNLTQNPGYN
jgi:hypothetical protein